VQALSVLQADSQFWQLRCKFSPLCGACSQFWILSSGSCGANSQLCVVHALNFEGLDLGMDVGMAEDAHD
jgi:hypothetical protein